jgi:hypothetical protein
VDNPTRLTQSELLPEEKMEIPASFFVPQAGSGFMA